MTDKRPKVVDLKATRKERDAAIKLLSRWMNISRYASCIGNEGLETMLSLSVYEQEEFDEFKLVVTEARAMLAELGDEPQ